jgi:Transposase DDE domain
MRSRKIGNISSAAVHQWTLEWLLESRLLKDHGWLCTAAVVWNIVLRAAARLISVSAACRDLASAPSDQAVFDALSDGLPKTRKVLERRLNEALTFRLPRCMRKRAWAVAIDFHLEPYYGEPSASKNELYYGESRQGTTKFHAYATACIIEYGERYTLALTWVRRHEGTEVALQRLITRIREIGLPIRRLQLDRGFFTTPVIAYLQQEQLPFLMPVMFRGRSSKNRRATGLRAIRRQKAGWYKHTLKNKKREGVTFSVCVSYRTHRNKKGKRVQKKLLFAAWKVHGTPTDIREEYRLRFGIETSYRQMRQARISTCTRDPHLRLVFIMIALLLRNFWVWIHTTRLADGAGVSKTVRLERLRFKRMLDWLAQAVSALLHDGSEPYVIFDP